MTVATDQSEYMPWEPVALTVSGLTPGESVELQVLHTDGTVNTGQGHDAVQLIDGGEYDLDALADGDIQTMFYVDENDIVGSTFEIIVTGLASGEVGSAQFTGIEDPGPSPVTTTVATDKLDYQPGETAVITAAGFAVGETIEFLVLHVDDTPNTGAGHEPWQVVDGSADDLDGVVDGSIQTTWYVTEDDSLGSVFNVTVTGLTSGNVARAEFSDDRTPSQTHTLLSDSFEIDFSSENWDLGVTNAYRDYDHNHEYGPHIPPYGSWAAAFNGKDGSFDNENNYLTSRSFDLSNYLSGSLNYWVQQGGHDDPPVEGDNLLIEYWAEEATWKELSQEYPSNFSSTEEWQSHWVDLPWDAFHSDFQFRFNAEASDEQRSGFLGSYYPADYWFIDRVKLYADPNERPAVSATAHSTGTHDDSESHRFSWTASDPDGNLSSASARLQWRENEGDPWQDIPGRSTADPSQDLWQYSSDGPGEYKLRVNATDALGLGRTVDSAILRINTPPTAEIDGPYAGEEGTTLVLDAFGSTDPDQATDTLICEWDLDYVGSNFTTDVISDQPRTEVLFVDDFAQRLIALRVTDEYGKTDVATTFLTINNVAPISNAGPDQVVSVGSLVSLAPARFTDAGAADTHTAMIDWGDETVDAGIVSEPFRGPVSTDEAILQVSPPTSVANGALESDAEIHLFEEQQVLTLAAPLKVDITSPGTYDPQQLDSDSSIAAGAMVNSYFLHWDPETASAAPSSSVTFDQDILGVIVLSSTLDASDSAVGLAEVTYPAGYDTRGLELANSPDFVSLSADLRTLTLGSFYVSTGVDQVRVITEAAGAVAGSHVYADYGSYTVTVTVTDDEGEVGSDTLTITAPGPFVIEPPHWSADSGLTLSVANGILHVYETGISHDVVRPRDLSAVTEVVITGRDIADDELTIDFSDGNPIPLGGLTFDGGFAGNDALVLLGGTFATVTHRFSGPGSGEIDLGAGVGLITYASLEQIADNLDVANREFLFGSDSETITLSDAGVPGNSQSRIESTLAEAVTFTNPTGALTIYAGDTGDDVINIDSLAANYPAHVSIDGQTGSDTVNVNGAISLNNKNLTIAADMIDTNQAISASGGNVSLISTGDITLRDAVTTGGASEQMLTATTTVTGRSLWPFWGGSASGRN